MCIYVGQFVNLFTRKNNTNKRGLMKRKRLDESFSLNTWKKCITGKVINKIDISKIKISKTGIIEPANKHL